MDIFHSLINFCVLDIIINSIGSMDHQWTIAVDATECVTVEGCSIIQVGVLDDKAGFKPFLMVFSDKQDKAVFQWIFEFVKEHAKIPPTSLMADGCQATRSACKEVFPDTLLAMCYWHVLKNTKRKIGK